MWWVVSQIWLNSDSNELSQNWVRLVNLGFELSRSWVRLTNLGFELSRSWVTWIVIWVRVESVRKKLVEHNPGWEGLWYSGSLMMTLAVTGAPDSHRGPVFLADTDGQRGPDCPDVLFVSFRTDFVTSVRVSVASTGVLALAGLRPAGARKPQGDTPPPPPPLG